MGTVNTTLRVRVSDHATRDLKRMESNIIRVVGSISAAFAAANLILFPIKSAIAFEKEMKNVEKTTNFNSEAMDRLSGSLLEMSRVMGISAVKMAEIAAIAGQLGLGGAGVKAIEAFTESVARASVTLGLSSQLVGEFGAQVAAIFNINPGNLEKVFSAVNEVSNNTVASGKDIIDIVKRIGTVASDSVSEVIALAGSLKQLGVTNEVGATFFTKFFPRMRTQAQKFADVMGYTTAEWNDFLNTKGNLEAFLAVSKKLSTLPPSEQIAQIKDLGGEGSRSLGVFVKYVQDAKNNQTQLARAIGISAKAFESGTSSIEEYEKIIDSVNKQINIFTESFRGLSIGAGNKSLGAIQSEIVKLSEILRDPAVKEYFEKLGQSIANIVRKIGDFGRYMAGFAGTIGLLGQAISAVILLAFGKWVSSVIIALGGAAYGAVASLVLVFGKLYTQIARVAGIIAGAYMASITGATAAVGLHTKALLWLQATYASFILKLKGASTALGLTGFNFKSFLIILKSIVKFLAGTHIGRLISLLAIVGAAIALNLEAFAKAMGYVDEKTRAIERRIRIAADNAKKNLREAQASLDDFTKKVTLGQGPVAIDPFQGFFDSKSVKLAINETVGGAAVMGRALLSAEKAIGSITSQMGAFNKETVAGKGKITDLNKEIAGFEKKLSGVYVGEGIFSSLFSNNYIQEGLRSNIEDAKKEIAGIEEQAAKADGEVSKLSKQLIKQVEEYEKLSTLSKKSFGEVLSSVFSTELIAYAKVDSQFRLAEERIKSLKKEKSILDKDLESTPEDDDSYDDKSSAAAKKTAELDKVGASVNDLARDVKNAFIQLDDTDKKLTTVFENMKPDELEAVSRVLRDVDSTSEALSKTYESMAPKAIAYYVNIKKLKDEYHLLSANTIAYGKTAKSVFNNVGNEIVALQRKVQSFNIEFDKLLQDRSIDLETSEFDREVDYQFDKQEKRVEKHYDYLIARATGSNKKRLELEKERSLEVLRLERTGVKAEQEKTSLLEKYETTITRVRDAIQQAQRASEAGQADRALELRESAKSEFDSLQDIIKQLAALKGTSLENQFEIGVTKGDIVNLVSDSELEELRDKFTDTALTLEGGLKKSAAALNENVAKQAAGFQKIATNLQASFEGVKGTMDQLQTVFGNVYEVAERMGKSLEAASQTDFSDLLANMSELTGSGFHWNIDPTELGKITSEGLENGTNDLARKIAPKVAEGVKDGLIKSDYSDVAIDQSIADAFTKDPDGRKKIDLNIDVAAMSLRIEKMPPPLIPVDIQINDIFGLEKLTSRVDFVKAKGDYRGGPIVGPGSATSDSIPRWLSNGEYVIDAMTTRMFGGSFFAGLQSIARGGKSISRITNNNGLPGMAEGGPVSTGNVVTLNMNLNGAKATVYGAKEHIDTIVNSMNQLEKGLA